MRWLGIEEYDRVDPTFGASVNAAGIRHWDYLNEPPMIRSAFFLVSIILSTLIALFAPVDILARHSISAQAANALGAVVPGIARLAAVSSFPEVTQFVMTVAWGVIVPLQIGLYFLSPLNVNIKAFFEHPLLLRIVSVIAVAAGLWWVFALYAIAPSDLEGYSLHSMILRQISTSRLGLGFWTGIFTTFFAAALCALITVAKSLAGFGRQKIER